MLNNISFSNKSRPEYLLCQEIIQSVVDIDNDIENAIEFDYKCLGTNTGEILENE